MSACYRLIYTEFRWWTVAQATRNNVKSAFISCIFILSIDVTQVFLSEVNFVVFLMLTTLVLRSRSLEHGPSEFRSQSKHERLTSICVNINSRQTWNAHSFWFIDVKLVRSSSHGCKGFWPIVLKWTECLPPRWSEGRIPHSRSLRW